jgi:hypothetical protein
VESSLKQSTNRLKTCYDQQLRANPLLAGTVTFDLAIAADGHVTSATVKTSTLSDSTLEACLAAVLSRLSFPATADGQPAGVTVPIELAS